MVVGFVYPAYASFKALESKTPESSAQWLTYWIIFGIFNVFEFFADAAISWQGERAPCDSLTVLHFL